MHFDSIGTSTRQCSYFTSNKLGNVRKLPRCEVRFGHVRMLGRKSCNLLLSSRYCKWWINCTVETSLPATISIVEVCTGLWASVWTQVCQHSHGKLA